MIINIKNVKLNLASGTDIRSGWFNLDVVPKWPNTSRECDIIWDATIDNIPFTDNSANEIYAGYLLLHLPPIYHKQVLSEIRRVLNPGGILLIGEVDMRILFEKWLENPHDEYLSGLIWGEQGNLGNNGDYRLDKNIAQYDKHCHGFTQESLYKLLDENGFCDFERIKIHSEEVFYEMTIKARKK